MKVPPRLVPNTKEPQTIFHEQRLVPRFPLPKEQIRFNFEDGEHKVCAIRDLSARGVGISLLEHGESLLFPLGQQYEAELKIDGDSLKVPLVVRRVSAWSVGFEFAEVSQHLAGKITAHLNPMSIGRSLKHVALELNPEVAVHGISSWYHGTNGTDLYFWNDARGGLERALLCLGEHFWEWSLVDKQRTGSLERTEGDNVEFNFDSESAPAMVELSAKVLENAEVLDYRLVNFLKDQMRS